jgi:ribosome-associated protein
MKKPESRKKTGDPRPFDKGPDAGIAAEASSDTPAPLGPIPQAILDAIAAAQDKKASDLVALDLRRSDAFTDFFLLCSGQNVRQVKAIVDSIDERLRKDGTRPAHVEGYDRAEWVLLDYFDFVIHVFTPDCRKFYALERLWGSAERVEIDEPASPENHGARSSRPVERRAAHTPPSHRR